jgi:hydrogenase maturation protease
MTVGVFGIGNLLRSDDAFGPRVVQRIESAFQFSSDVYVADLGSPGLDLAMHIAGFDLLILIDTVAMDGEPGKLWRLTREDLVPSELAVAPAHRAEVHPKMTQHDAGLADALCLADLYGCPPGEVVLIGVTPACLDQGVGLSEAVEAAIEPAVGAVLDELRRAGVTVLVESPAGTMIRMACPELSRRA